MTKFFQVTKLLIFNLLDTYFLQIPVLVSWILIAFNLHCYFIYQNILFLFSTGVLGLNLAYLFYEDYCLFNLKVKNNVLSQMAEKQLQPQICFDQSGKILWASEVMKMLVLNDKFDTVLDFIALIKRHGNDEHHIMASIDSIRKKPQEQNLKKILENTSLKIKINNKDFVLILNTIKIDYSNKALFTAAMLPHSTEKHSTNNFIESIIDHSNNGYLVVDFRKKVLFGNKTVCNWLSCDLDHLKYLNFEEILQQRENLYLMMDENYNSGSVILQFADSKKEVFWEKETIGNKESRDLYTIFRLYEKQQIKEDNKEKEIVSRLQCPVIIFKTTGEIQMFNSSCQQFFKNPLNKNSKITNLIKPETIEKILSKANKLLGDTFYDINAEECSFSENIKKARVYPMNLGSINVFLFYNITEFFLQEKQLYHAQRLMTTGEILSGIVHDLNNYLMPILGYTESISRKIEIGDPIYTDIMHLQDNGARAANLIKYVLNMSKKHDSNLDCTTDVTSKIEQLLTSLSKLLGKKITIRFTSLNQNQPVQISQIYLEQILTNLLVNSRDSIIEKIQKNKLQEGEIRITTDQIQYNPDVQHSSIKKEFLRIKVKDNGEGIAPLMVKRIFDPFYTTKKNVGVGLGLSTVKKIVQEHKGAINVDSEEGVGTTITILLPIKVITEREPHSENKNEPAKSSLYSNSNTEVMLDSGTILILEDSLSIRRLLSEQLNKIGYDVIEASSGNEALLKAENHQGTIDVLISDVNLPDEKLVTVCDGIKKKYPSIIVILSSGDSELTVKDLVADAFNYTFFSKPFPLRDMIHAIQSLKNSKTENKNK